MIETNFRAAEEVAGIEAQYPPIKCLLCWQLHHRHDSKQVWLYFFKFIRLSESLNELYDGTKRLWARWRGPVINEKPSLYLSNWPHHVISLQQRSWQDRGSHKKIIFSFNNPSLSLYDSFSSLLCVYHFYLFCIFVFRLTST